MAALRARFGAHLERALQTARLFESPMSSLLHELLPGNQDMAPHLLAERDKPGDATMPHVAAPPRAARRHHSAASRISVGRFLDSSQALSHARPVGGATRRPDLFASGWRPRDSVGSMAEELDVEAMIARFRERADAVRRRGIPPVEGEERRRIMRQMRLDFQDFAMLGDASGSLEDGILTLRVDLRPADTEPAPAGEA
jgi:hypothetical protein